MSEYKTLNVEEPIDLIKLSLNETVLIKCRQNRTLKGKLHVGFDLLFLSSRFYVLNSLHLFYFFFIFWI